MYRSPSRLPEDSRRRIVAVLNRSLADGLDLHSQIKVAHWNIKGPHFSALHPQFETFAVGLAAFNDEIAERAVTLGGHVYGTLRHAAQVSRVPEYDQEAQRDLDHVRLLAERFDAYIEGLREARGVGEKEGDTDTVDLLTGVISEFEKHTWFLRATLAE
jgi:starvation-inducible DNA-binding protein